MNYRRLKQTIVCNYCAHVMFSDPAALYWHLKKKSKNDFIKRSQSRFIPRWFREKRTRVERITVFKIRILSVFVHSLPNVCFWWLFCLHPVRAVRRDTSSAAGLADAAGGVSRGAAGGGGAAMPTAAILCQWQSRLGGQVGRDEVPCRPGTDGVSAPTFKGTGHNLLFFFLPFCTQRKPVLFSLFSTCELTAPLWPVFWFESKALEWIITLNSVLNHITSDKQTNIHNLSSPITFKKRTASKEIMMNHTLGTAQWI